jgi:hypothetical protein
MEAGKDTRKDKTLDGKHYHQIARGDARDTILDITDCDFSAPLYDRAEESRRKKAGEQFAQAPRIQFELVNYDKNKPEGERGVSTKHWLDEGSVLLMMDDILKGRKGKPTESNGRKFYEAFFTDFRGSNDKDLDGKLVSRKISVNYNDSLERIGPCYEFSFKKTDGEKNQMGAVMPKKGGVVYFEGKIRMPVDMARKLALEVTSYIQAKKAAQIAQARTQPAGRPQPAQPRTEAPRPSQSTPPANRPPAPQAQAQGNVRPPQPAAAKPEAPAYSDNPWDESMAPPPPSRRQAAGAATN